MESLSIFIFIFLIMILIIEIYIYRYSIDAIINRRIRLNGHTLFMYSATSPGGKRLIRDGIEIDQNVHLCKVKLFRYYLYGDKGFYIVNRYVNRMHSYSLYEDIPYKFRRMFMEAVL